MTKYIVKNLHTFEILWIISQVFIGLKVLGFGPFFYIQIYVSSYFDNLVQAFSNYLVDNDCSKMNRSFSYQKWKI